MHYTCSVSELESNPSEDKENHLLENSSVQRGPNRASAMLGERGVKKETQLKLWSPVNDVRRQKGCTTSLTQHRQITAKLN